jgi:hypothetical protein
MNSITADELKTHLYIVASLKWKEEKAGSAKAGEYLINHYTKEGLTYPKEQQTFIKLFCRILNKKGRS